MKYMLIINPYPAAKMSYAKLLVNYKLNYFIVLQSHSKLVKILSKYQTAWIWVRHRVTWHLIQIRAVCINDYGKDRQDKG